jgi:hypothetical protein
MVPPLREQERVASLIRERQTDSEKLRTALEEEAATIEALPVALLRRAFSGQV